MLLAEEASGGNPLLNFLPIVAIVVLMYFLLIRPQNKRRREMAQMQSQIGPGDEIQTAGGLYATVVSMDDESVTVEAAPGVVLRFGRNFIGRRVVDQTAVTADDTDDSADDDVDTSDAKTPEKG